MAERSGFFNALRTGGEYDRTYNANDYNENLAVVISTGVLRSENDDLKVTASGMTLTVASGRAWINGRWYNNDSPVNFTVPTAPSGGSRYDRVVLRSDNTLARRSIYLTYLTGTAGNDPQKPVITRNDEIYDIVLADIRIAAGATTVTVTDTRADNTVCGWVYSTSGDNSFFTTLDHSFNEWFTSAKDNLASVTLFKRYTWKTTLSAATSTIAFSIPQYDPETCFLEVYVNGIFDNRHSIANNVITFVGTLVAGTVVNVNCYKSIDGTGIMSVADEITELQNQVATIIGTNKFVYSCTGLNDNIALSEIAQAIYSGSYVAASVSAAAAAFLSAIGGNTYLAQLPAEAQIEIDVVGKLGATTPAAGSGTTASRYRWFNFGVAGSGEKRVIFNFAKCQKITIACSASTNNIIFYGTDLNIRNANVYAYSNGASCIITMVAGSANNGNINCSDCRFSVSTSDNAVISENGNFTNCYCVVKSSAGNAVCFSAKNDSLIRLLGGTYYAYVANSAKSAVIMNIVAGETNAVILAHNINAPTVAVTGYIQKNLAVAGTGNVYIDGVVSTMESQGATVQTQGQIWKSKR